MAIGKREAPPQMTADFLVKDGEGRSILIGFVRARGPEPEGPDKLQILLQVANAVVPFGLIADLERIRIYRWDGLTLDGPVFDEATGAILTRYDGVFGTEPVGNHLLQALIGAWFRDLAYRWKHPDPPGVARLTAIGLLPELDRYSETLSEVTIGGHPVP